MRQSTPDGPHRPATAPGRPKQPRDPRRGVPPRPEAPARRALLAAVALGGAGLLAAGCGDESASADQPAASGTGTDGSTSPRRSRTDRSSGGASGRGPGSASPSPTKRRPELPRGGRSLFPRHRLVGFCGLPGATALGRLGTGDPDDRAAEIEKAARKYADGREPLPVLELLATVATTASGPGGTYRTRTPDRTIDRFHRVARAHRAMLLLNIQPGRAHVLDEVKALRDWLVHPDVGIALDPEWEMGPGEVPGNTYGHTSGQELTHVARYLSGLVADHDLPEKPLVFHQVAPSVLRDQRALRPYDGVVLIKSADGIGSPGLKRATWHQLVRDMPKGLHTGFKLFYDEDTRNSRLMTPKEVLALRPKPEYVMFE